MTLFKQISIIITIVFVILFITIVSVSFNIINDSTKKESYQNAQNIASSLAYTISNTCTSQTNIETAINASFDNGNYESIIYRDVDNNIAYIRKIESQEKNFPTWFENLIYLEVPISKATLSNNWNILGTVEVISDRNTIYFQLYSLLINLISCLSISCIIFLIIIYYLSHLIIKPLVEIQNQSKLIMKNEFVIQKIIPKTKEFGTIVRSINQMIIKFEEIYKMANNTLSENSKLLYLDNVTSLSTRKYFFLKVAEFSSDENKKNNGCIIAISIKKMDLLNKKIGYQNTDTLIYEFAQFLKRLVSKNKDAILCRLNGSEIIVMLPNTKLDFMPFLINKVIKNFEEKLDKLELGRDEFGIYSAILEYDLHNNKGKLLTLIDYSLSQSKLLLPGKYYELPCNNNNNVAIKKQKWKEIILLGLENGNFQIVFRKVLDTKSKEKIYNIVTFSLIHEDEIYSYGILIAPIMDLLLISEVYLNFIKKVLLSKNCSFETPTIIQLPQEFLTDMTVYLELKALFHEVKKHIKCNIIFEIPEVLLLNHYENSLLYIKLFKNYGFNFGINSFIANGKDFKYIKELKPIFIKSNVHYLLDEEQNINILKIILESLDIKLLACGVSTKEELNILTQKNINNVSGLIVEELNFG